MVMTNVQELATRHCTPCEGNTPPLSQPQVRDLLARLPGWELKDSQIQRTYKFKNFHETMAFANAVAFIAHREDHHPDMELSYNKCTIGYSTHTIHGLSENDFISAAKVDALL